MQPLKYLSCVAAFSLTLAGCGGGGGSSATPPAAGGGSKTTQVSMNFTFSTKSSLAAKRHPNYVSFNTKGLGIYVKATGTGAFPATTAAMQNTTWATTIAPNFTGQGATCGAPTGSGSYTCNIILTAPVGYDDFQITTWDAPPAGQGFGATFPASANNLSFQNIVNQLVEVNSNNAFNYTLDGVVYNVVLDLSPSSLVTGAATGSATNPAMPVMTVRAIDADGNTIIGTDPYVDANGVPLTIKVAAAPAYPTAPSPAPAGPNGVVHLNDSATPATNDSCFALTANGGLTSPAHNTCVMTYNGGDIADVALTASTNSTLVGSAKIANTALNFTRTANGPIIVPGPPSITEYSAGLTPLANPYRPALGPDGRIWVADPGIGATPITQIAAIDTSGTITMYPVSSPQASVIAGPDGDMWFTTQNNGKVARINVDGSGYVELALSGFASGLSVGPDNNIYASENNGMLAKLASTASGPVLLNEFAIGTNLVAATSGPNSHVWALDVSSHSVLEVTTAGVVVNTYPYAAGAGHVLQSLTAGPDGNLWFSDFTAGAFARMTPAGTFTTYTVGGSADEINSGPDGNMWACTNGPDQIIRIDTTTGSVQKYTTGFTAGALTNGIATGADHNLWFTESTGNRIGKLTP